MTLASVRYAQLCQWFDWETGKVPLSSWEAPALGVVTYLTCIAILRAVLGGKAVQIPSLVAALHNLFLCVLSAIMMAGCAYEAGQVRPTHATLLCGRDIVRLR